MPIRQGERLKGVTKGRISFKTSPSFSVSIKADAVISTAKVDRPSPTNKGRVYEEKGHGIPTIQAILSTSRRIVVSPIKGSMGIGTL